MPPPPLVLSSLEHRYATFSDLDLCNFAVKVYSDGDLLSIVTECSSHGTHVAGIAAAYHPEVCGVWCFFPQRVLRLVARIEYHESYVLF